MNDLISRQAAIDAMMAEVDDKDRPNVELRWWNMGLTRASEILEQLPSAEPKTGRWMFPDPPIHKPICSECRKPCIGLHAFEYALTDYCPNCGARMEGENDA